MTAAANANSLKLVLWALAAVLSLSMVVLGWMFMQSMGREEAFRKDLKAFGDEIRTLSSNVSTLTTDVAVVKNTIQGLVQRDVPTRTELQTSLSVMTRDVTKLETRVTALEERVRLLENKK